MIGDLAKEEKIRNAREGKLLELLPALLEGVFGKGIPLDKYLNHFFRTHSNCGSRDRKEVSGFFYTLFRYWGVVRKIHSLPENAAEVPEKLSNASCARLLVTGFLLEGKENAPLLSCGKIGMEEALYKELLQVGAWEKRMEKWSAFPGNTPFIFAEKCLLPEWLPGFLPFPPDPRFFLLPLSRAKSYCRLRSLADKEMVEKEFASLGKKLFFHPRIPHAFYWEGEGESRLAYGGMKSYRKGAFEVQDLSSQLIALTALSVEGAEDAAILDYCCGAGGKTLLMASRLKKGKIFYSDIRKEILEEVEKRLARGAFRNARPWDHGKGGFDIVLVDAPCSSSGRIRHSPELWWLLSPEKVSSCGDLQLEILEEAAKFVKDDGVLAYGTCSFFPLENEEVAGEFLRRHPEFSPVKVPSPFEEGRLPFLQVFPWDGDCDGSFTALFKKNKVSKTHTI